MDSHGRVVLMICCDRLHKFQVSYCNGSRYRWWSFDRALVCSATVDCLTDWKICMIDAFFGLRRSSLCSPLHALAQLTSLQKVLGDFFIIMKNFLFSAARTLMKHRYMSISLSENCKWSTVLYDHLLVLLLRALQLPVPLLLAWIVTTWLCRFGLLLCFVTVAYRVRRSVWMGPARNLASDRNRGEIWAVPC